MIALLLALALTLTPSGVPEVGVASWYDATRHGQSSWYTRQGITHYGAVSSWRWGDKPYTLRVCRADDLSRCVLVTVVDYCGRCAADLRRVWTNKSRSIDLSPAAMVGLAPLHHGVVRVVISEMQTPKPSLTSLGMRAGFGLAH